MKRASSGGAAGAVDLAAGADTVDPIEAPPSDLGGERLTKATGRCRSERRATILHVRRALTDLANVRRHDVTAMWKTFLINTERQTATVCPLAADASQNSDPNSLD